MLGREILVKKAGATIGAITSKDVKIAKQGVDITSDSSAGFRTFASKAGMLSLDISWDGVFVKDAIATLMLSPNDSCLLTDVTLVWDDGGTIACNFWIGEYQLKAAHDKAVECSGSFASSGPWTYTT